MADYKVTVELDFTVDPPEDGVEIDEDEFSDGLTDFFDSVDLEGSYEGVVYDDQGEDTEERQTFTFNCDRVRVADVIKMGDG